MKRSKSIIAAALIFIGCLVIGFGIARHKALWTDEFYSQAASIHNTSYADQFLGHIPEGGNDPLFYSLQKVFLKLVHYQTPSQWMQGNRQSDASSQILLRINPVIFMSLSVSLVFYYFCRRYSVGAGFLSLLIYISSHMLWAFWAEARPYALLVFLTTVQSVIFLKRMDQHSPTGSGRWWALLAVTNILLSLTSILSLGEILAVSALWWVFKERDWKKYIFVTLLPLAIVLFYYAHAPRYPFYFGGSGPRDIFYDNISRQWVYIFFIFLVLLSAYWVGRKKPVFKFVPGRYILKPVPYFIFMVLVLAASAVVLCLFVLHAKQGAQGFPVTSRYFIYLTPIGVISTTILTISLFKSLSKQCLMQGVVVGLIALLLGQHFLKVVPKEIHSMISG